MQNIEDKLKTRKVAIYIRVSTHWQVDKDSLQVQRRELLAYAQMILGIQDFVVFEDPGYSAKNTDRPAYQKMMDRLRTGEFSHLLVWKIDRISRNLLDFANMYEELKKLGVTFVSKNEQFDTSSAIGEAMLKIILIFAELERNMTAERFAIDLLALNTALSEHWTSQAILSPIEMFCKAESANTKSLSTVSRPCTSTVTIRWLRRISSSSRSAFWIKSPRSIRRLPP